MRHADERTCSSLHHRVAALVTSSAALTARAQDHDGVARLSPGPDGGSELLWEAWIR